MASIDTTKPVMITGATGYVAGWIVKELLQQGHTVHAPIRTPENKDKTKFLDELASQYSGNIKYFKADLLDEGSYSEAMKGCELVIHTASPFTTDTKNPKRDLIDPALKGTQNVLNTVNKTESVKRVVLTSSCVAICGDAKDSMGYPSQTMDESHWNTTSTVDHNPYNYSKVIAEKAAWDINKAQNRWDLIVINPSFVIGPGINPNATSESFKIFTQMGDGTAKMGIPNLSMGAVDVRDLAVAHYKAGFTPEAEGRHIVSGTNTTILEMVNHLKKKWGNQYPFPKGELSKSLIWIFAPIIGMTRKYVKLNVGYAWRADNRKSKEKLGMEYRPLETSVVEFFQQLVDNGSFKK